MRTRIGLGIAFLLASTACTGAVFNASDAGPTPGDDAGVVPPNGGGGSHDDAGTADSGSDAGTVDAAPPPPGCDVTKLPSEDACVVDDAVGVFVSSSMGSASGDGTKAKPFASLDAAIAAAKTAHKRVYACADVYAEQIHLADGVDVFGYFACSSNWAVVTSAHAKVVAPASPAATATGITDATRIEAVDLVAPDYTSASRSSIGLVAYNSPALTIKSATIHAGTGGKGADGIDGIQLTNGTGIDGADSWQDGTCLGGNCTLTIGVKTKAPGGGANACVGQSGHNGGSGGTGGTGGSFQVMNFKGYIWSTTGMNTSVGSPTTPTAQTAQGGGLGIGGSAGAAGANGTAGYGGVDFGGLSVSTGYAPADGTNGTSGAPGQGGGGSGGVNMLTQDYPPQNYTASQVSSGVYGWGEPGAGGGAGGCPGLAGTAGKGGGASIAVVAEQSPFTLDHVTIESSPGGAGGKAGSASKPTVGGFGGKPALHTTGGGNGGSGGYAGASGNGGGGPSIGIAYQGTAPTRLATSITHGAGGAGVAARVGNDGKTIPASMNGVSLDLYIWGA